VSTSEKPPLQDIVAATSLDPAALALRIEIIERFIVNWQALERTKYGGNPFKLDEYRHKASSSVLFMQRILAALDYARESK